MRSMKLYEPSDKMVDLIEDNYNILQTLASFGIPLGFGDQTVEQTCRTNQVDTTTFLAVVNLTINGSQQFHLEDLSASTLLHYLKACHCYFMHYQVPRVRLILEEALNKNDSLGGLIIEVYDQFSKEVRRHMQYEDRMLFPYVQHLIDGDVITSYCIDDFSKQHAETEQSIRELKNLIIKYFPGQPHADIDHDKDHGHQAHQLSSALSLIFNEEQWLAQHQLVEDVLFIPLMRNMETGLRTERVNSALSAFANANAINTENDISDREKDVIVGVVEGLSNKEIAAKLCISVNTVTTHRKNIARKLQIHSPAGLTIYAITNGLVEIK